MMGQPTDRKRHHMMMKYLCYFSFFGERLNSSEDLTVHELTSCKKDKQVTNVKEVPHENS
jgi:hypothetical protein